MQFLFKIIILTLAIIITAALLPGVSVENNNIFTAIVAAVVISFLNSVLKPLLIILTIPITVFTLGFFLLVINAFIILLTDKLVDGFSVKSFWWALLFSVVLTFVNSLLESVQNKNNNEGI